MFWRPPRANLFGTRRGGKGPGGYGRMHKEHCFYNSTPLALGQKFMHPSALLGLLAFSCLGRLRAGLPTDPSHLLPSS